jgi:NAD(P)H-nitrite reductase large subunit
MTLSRGEVIVALDSRSGRYRRLVLAGDRLVGAVLIGELADAPALRELIERGRPVPAELLDGGLAAAPVQDDDPGALVCSCNAVTRHTIERAIAAGGLERVEQVAAATAATTGCGGCRPRVEALLTHPRDRAASR